MSDRNSEKSDFSQFPQTQKEIAVKWAYRWEVFRRLKALEINCQCSTNQPLLVDLNSPTTLIQVWSVIRHTNAERRRLIDWLNDCWEVKYDCQSK